MATVNDEKERAERVERAMAYISSVLRAPNSLTPARGYSWITWHSRRYRRDRPSPTFMLQAIGPYTYTPF